MWLMDEPAWNFEQEPHDPTDETGVEWDGNFRDDGALMLICSERDVDVAEYRKALEECIRYRERMRVPA